MQVRLIQLWTAMHVLVVKWGSVLCIYSGDDLFTTTALHLHVLGCRGQRKRMHCSYAKLWVVAQLLCVPSIGVGGGQCFHFNMQ